MGPNEAMVLQENFFWIFGAIWFVVILILVLMVVCLWKIFTKAGKPGWASIVPIYNIIVELEIIGMPLWFIALFFIPIVNNIVVIVLNHHLAQVFGKGIGYTIGLSVLPFIFLPMLAFGDAKYQGVPKPL